MRGGYLIFVFMVLFSFPTPAYPTPDSDIRIFDQVDQSFVEGVEALLGPYGFVRNGPTEWSWDNPGNGGPPSQVILSFDFDRLDSVSSLLIRRGSGFVRVLVRVIGDLNNPTTTTENIHLDIDFTDVESVAELCRELIERGIMTDEPELLERIRLSRVPLDRFLRDENFEMIETETPRCFRLRRGGIFNRFEINVQIMDSLVGSVYCDIELVSLGILGGRQRVVLNVVSEEVFAVVESLIRDLSGRNRRNAISHMNDMIAGDYYDTAAAVFWRQQDQSLLANLREMLPSDGSVPALSSIADTVLQRRVLEVLGRAFLAGFLEGGGIYSSFSRMRRRMSSVITVTEADFSNEPGSNLYLDIQGLMLERSDGLLSTTEVEARLTDIFFRRLRWRP